MRLNPDCTRAVLMAIEEVCDTNTLFSSSSDLGAVKGGFDTNEIAYHIRQCDMAGMICGFKQDLGANWSVKDLTPKGHEFLANIREDNIWNKVKTVSVKVGSKSISGLMQIASAVVTELIKNQFGLR